MPCPCVYPANPAHSQKAGERQSGPMRDEKRRRCSLQPSDRPVLATRMDTPPGTTFRSLQPQVLLNTLTMSDEADLGHVQVSG